MWRGGVFFHRSERRSDNRTKLTVSYFGHAHEMYVLFVRILEPPRELTRPGLSTAAAAKLRPTSCSSCRSSWSTATWSSSISTRVHCWSKQHREGVGINLQNIVFPLFLLSFKSLPPSDCFVWLIPENKVKKKSKLKILLHEVSCRLFMHVGWLRVFLIISCIGSAETRLWLVS